MSVAPPNDGLVGLAPIVPRSALGTMPNLGHQPYAGFMQGASYELAVVEFDDQGRCYDRNQMDGVAQRLDALSSANQDAILVAFVHGWKHDARTDDDNLSAFRVLLNETVDHEKANTVGGGQPRPVLGIFVGWRGLSEFGLGDAVADATFWGRQAAAQRVATGSVRELFGRLRTYRNQRLDNQGAPLLVIAGHSFGGMIVYSALAQSLIEAASAPPGQLTPSFADLVLLVNPAIEGARYLPIQDIVDSGALKRRSISQLPIFICAQAENDQPIGTWFPVGNTAHRLDEATIGDLEKDCVTHALGFVDSFRTHKLSGPAAGKPFVLSPGDMAQVDPFWVVAASSEVINGHGGIWQSPFLQFLASIVFQHVKASKAPERSAPARAQGESLRALNLANFASTLKTIKLE